jgi:hypothetical protein
VRQLVADRLAHRMGRRHRLHAIDVRQEVDEAGLGLVPGVDRLGLRVHAFAADRAHQACVNRVGRRIGCVVVVSVGNAGGDVRAARGVVPVRRVVAAHAEVRTADDLEIVGKARVPDGEVVGCEVDLFARDQPVDERHGRVVDDLLEPVVLQHDHKHMV